MIFSIKRPGICPDYILFRFIINTIIRIKLRNNKKYLFKTQGFDKKQLS